MIKSVDKLRDYGHQCCARIDDAIHDYCDEIEAEIAEHYMELPVDADSVPIRLGDTVREVDDRVPMKVMSLTFYEDCVDVNACGMNPNLLRHVKSRTLENVLTEMLDRNTDGVGLREFNRDFGAFVAHYADEIRELLLGGEGESDET